MSNVDQQPSTIRVSKTVFWFPALLWGGLTFFLSMIPRVGPSSETAEHKIGHIAVFATLAATVIWALDRGHALRLSRALVLAMLITAAYGASDEWHQKYVPGRSCEFSDVVLDTVAGAVALFAYYICRSLRVDDAELSAVQTDVGRQVRITTLRRFAYWLPALSCAGLIFYLSSESKLPEIGRLFPDKDKIEHFAFYIIFWVLILLPFRRAHHVSLARAIVGTFLITSAYAASIEFHQRSRLNSTDIVADWAADTMAGFIAAAAYWVYETRPTSKRVSDPRRQIRRSR
jgi:VanZ family protein